MVEWICVYVFFEFEFGCVGYVYSVLCVLFFFVLFFRVLVGVRRRVVFGVFDVFFGGGCVIVVCGVFVGI